MMRFVLLFALFFSSVCFGWSWNDLWYNTDQQAAQHYREKKYDVASENFSSHYNRGNSLAHMKKLKEAISAYDEALKKDPNNSDAKFNRDLLKKMKKKKQKQQSKSDKKQKRQANKKQDKKKKAKNHAHKKQAPPKKKEQNQSDKQLLQSVPDDPGGFLRRKFSRDYRRRLRGGNQW